MRFTYSADGREIERTVADLFQQMRNLPKNSEEHRFKVCDLARAIYRARKLTKSRFDKIVDDFLSLFPDRVAGKLVLAELFYQASRVGYASRSALEFAFVESWFRSVISENSPDGYLGLAKLYSRENPCVAQKYFEQAVAENVDDAKRSFAHFYLARRDYANAEKWFLEDDRYVEKHPQCISDLLCRWSLQLMAKGETENSAAIERRMLNWVEAHPTGPSLEFAVAQAYQSVERGIYFEGCDSPSDKKLCSIAGKLAREKAIEHFERCLSSGILEAGRAIGDLIVNADPKGAEAYYERLNDRVWFDKSKLAGSFLRKDDYKSAAKWFVEDLKSYRLSEHDRAREETCLSACLEKLDTDIAPQLRECKNDRELEDLFEKGALEALCERMEQVFKGVGLQSPDDDIPF